MAASQPFAGFRAYGVHLDGFAESGGAAALRVAERSRTYAFADVGVWFETPIMEALSARSTASWQRWVDGNMLTAFRPLRHG